MLLVDQAQFPRSKVCGGCLNGSSLAALAHLGLAKLPEQLGGQPIRSLHLGTRGRAANIALAASVSISREIFDAALVEHCQRAGVTFRPGVRAAMENVEGNVRRITLRTVGSHGKNETVGRAEALRSPTLWQWSSRELSGFAKPQPDLQNSIGSSFPNAFTETMTATTRIVILAHGLKAGAVDPHSRIGAGVLLAESPQDYPLHAISMAVGEGGYVGGVHVEDGRFDLAAAFDAGFVKAKGSLGLAAADVLRQAGFPAIPGLEAAHWKGTPLLTRRPMQIAGERWFAVGDAAGYVEPFTGEGIAWAMNGAIALAPIVASAIVKWDDAHAKSWARIHARQIGRRQLQCRVLAKVLRSRRLSSLLVRCVSHFPVLAAPFVRTLNRPVSRGAAL